MRQGNRAATLPVPRMQSPTKARYLHGLRASDSSFTQHWPPMPKPGEPYAHAFISEPGHPNLQPCDCGWAGLGPHVRTRRVLIHTSRAMVETLGEIDPRNRFSSSLNRKFVGRRRGTGKVPSVHLTPHQRGDRPTAERESKAIRSAKWVLQTCGYQLRSNPEGDLADADGYLFAATSSNRAFMYDVRSDICSVRPNDCPLSRGQRTPGQKTRHPAAARRSDQLNSPTSDQDRWCASPPTSGATSQRGCWSWRRRTPPETPEQEDLRTGGGQHRVGGDVRRPRRQRRFVHPGLLGRRPGRGR